MIKQDQANRGKAPIAKSSQSKAPVAATKAAPEPEDDDDEDDDDDEEVRDVLYRRDYDMCMQ